MNAIHEWLDDYAASLESIARDSALPATVRSSALRRCVQVRNWLVNDQYSAYRSNLPSESALLKAINRGDYDGKQEDA